MVSQVLPDDELLAGAVAMAEGMCAFSPFGLALTKDTMWAALEVGSLRAAVDLENRTQLLAGHTGNLAGGHGGLQGEAAARLHRVAGGRTDRGQGPPRRQTPTGAPADPTPSRRAGSTGGPTASPKARFASAGRGQPRFAPSCVSSEGPTSIPTGAASAADGTWATGRRVTRARCSTR